jgi:prepilin-type N-terminal cleavage/methylation domain-containing protein
MPSLNSKPPTPHLKHGFTLIELLIVMTVLGILAGLALASYGGVQEKARDSKRKQELSALKKALNLYADNNNGVFPGQSPGTLCIITTQGGSWQASGCSVDMQALLVSQYIAKLPLDPSANNSTQYYGYATSMWCGPDSCSLSDASCVPPPWTTACTNRVALWAYLENTKDPDKGDAGLFGYGGAGRREYMLLVDE